MRRAEEEVDLLFDQGLRLLAQPARDEALHDPQGRPAADVWPLIVYNPLAWRRSDVVIIAPPEPRRKIDSIRNATSNQPVAFDIDEAGRAVFIARDMPSLGYATFNVETAPGAMDVDVARSFARGE